MANDTGVTLPDFSAYEGRLAESWTFDAATLTWTVKLRQGVKGCGGTTFNADDVVYTFARAKSVSGAAPIGGFLSNVGSIKGFGGYCLDTWTKGESISYTANEDYFAGAPAIKKVKVQRVPQSSNRVVVLQSGQAQLVTGLTPREFDSLRAQDGLVVGAVTGNENLFLHMNFKTAPFDNPLVRRAIAHAIPFEQIIANGYFGQATQWAGLVPSSYPGHKASAAFVHDPAKAKALLAEAGYADGAGLDAFADAFRLSYVAEKESTLGPIVNIIQTALREVGIPATLDPIPQTQYGERQLVKRDLPFAINDQEKPIGVDAGYAIQLFFVSADKGGLNNMVNYSSAAVDDAWAKARVEPDPAKRTAMVGAIQDQLAADVAWLPIVEYKTQWAMTAKLSGLRWYPDNSIRYVDLKLTE